MSGNKNTVKITQSHYEEIKIEWEITDFFTSGSLNDHSRIFSFAKHKWILCISWARNSMWLQMSDVINNNEPRENWKCKLGVKKTDGDVLYFPKPLISFATSIFRLVLLRLKDDLTFSNNLIIVCNLQHICPFSEPSTSQEYAPLKLISK